MARSIARIITALTLGLALVAAPVISATAAQAADVTISKIGTKKAKKGKTVTIKPVVKTAGDKVKVTSKTLTVTKGKKKVATDATSAKLKIGSYKVTTTVKYQIKQKLSTSKAVEMHCQVVDTELNTVDGVDVDLMFLDCTGDAFSGVYKARMGYIYDPLLASIVGDNIWGDSFIEHPTTTIYPYVGSKFAAKVKPVDGAYKWVEKTKTRTQTLKVKKK